MIIPLLIVIGVLVGVVVYLSLRKKKCSNCPTCPTCPSCPNCPTCAPAIINSRVVNLKQNTQTPTQYMIDDGIQEGMAMVFDGSKTNFFSNIAISNILSLYPNQQPNSYPLKIVGLSKMFLGVVEVGAEDPGQTSVEDELKQKAYQNGQLSDTLFCSNYCKNVQVDELAVYNLESADGSQAVALSFARPFNPLPEFSVNQVLHLVINSV